jgi:hypothetical protein
MNKRPLLILFTIIDALCLSGCVTDFQMDDTVNSAPVVNCLLHNDSIQSLTLTRSVSVGDGYIFKEISDATITLSVGDSIVGSFSKVGYSSWRLRFRPSEKVQYVLKILLPDSTVMTASTIMPPSTMNFIKGKETDAYPIRHFLQLRAPQPVWAFIIDADRFLLKGDLPASDDKMNEMIGTNHPLADRFNQFGEFSGLLPDAVTPPYNYYVRFQPDSLSFDKNDSISFIMETTYGDHSFIFFRTASEEYDNYLKTSLQKIWICKDETDPGQWFDESVVFSNINHGVGIFAAYTDQIIRCNGW